MYKKQGKIMLSSAHFAMLLVFLSSITYFVAAGNDYQPPKQNNKEAIEELSSAIEGINALCDSIAHDRSKIDKASSAYYGEAKKSEQADEKKIFGLFDQLVECLKPFSGKLQNTQKQYEQNNANAGKTW